MFVLPEYQFDERHTTHDVRSKERSAEQQGTLKAAKKAVAAPKRAAAIKGSAAARVPKAKSNLPTNFGRRADEYIEKFLVVPIINKFEEIQQKKAAAKGQAAAIWLEVNKMFWAQAEKAAEWAAARKLVITDVKDEKTEYPAGKTMKEWLKDEKNLWYDNKEAMERLERNIADLEKGMLPSAE